MKAFTIDAENNITVYPSRKAADAAVESGDAGAGGSIFASFEQLGTALEDCKGNDLVEIFNSFTGVTPVKKFMDRKAAVRRIWAECDKMSIDRETPVTITLPELVEPEAPAAKPAKKAKPAAGTTQVSAPRETSKTAKLIELLKAPGGMTLDAICSEFGWQAHTTRALMSAGGAIFKKYGLAVISEKIGEARTYRIA